MGKETKMNETRKQFRSATLYIEPATHRWLSWLASLDDGQTADGLGEQLLRAAILMKYPKIEEAEATYHAARKKLNDAAKESLIPGILH